MSKENGERENDRPIETAKSFEDLKQLVMAEQLGYDVTEWNTEGILDTINDVEKLVSGQSDKEGRARRTNKEGALQDILDRFPNDGDLGILKTKLAEFAKLEK